MVFFYTLHVVKLKASVFIGSIYSFYGGGGCGLNSLFSLKSLVKTNM
ncbi:hypothetical protein [Helicobacter bilis]|nr:hypothetical protein [Helicobacter bilis]